MKFNRQRKSLNYKLVIFLTIGLMGIFAFIFNTNIFKIKSINIQSEKVDCANNQQLKDSTNILGQNFFILNKLGIEKKLKTKFICVKEINVVKKIPGDVEIKVLGREAQAVLLATPSAEATPEGFLVDDEGIIFSKVDKDFSAPKVFIENSDLFLGKKITEFNNALRILQAAKKFGLETSLSEISGNNLTILSGPKAIFKLDSQIDVQIASLQLILEKAKMDSSQLEFIDLRFDKPVIRIAPKK